MPLSRMLCESTGNAPAPSEDSTAQRESSDRPYFHVVPVRTGAGGGEGTFRCLPHADFLFRQRAMPHRLRAVETGP